MGGTAVPGGLGVTGVTKPLMGHFTAPSKHLHLLAGSCPHSHHCSTKGTQDWPDWEFCWDANLGKKGGEKEGTGQSKAAEPKQQTHLWEGAALKLCMAVMELPALGMLLLPWEWGGRG